MTTIVHQIVELLMLPILSDIQLTRTHIQILQDQLRLLLAPQMDFVPNALIYCLSNIVIRRRKQRSILPNAINREISQYLSIPDAEKYLVGIDLPSAQITDQIAKRWEQRIKEYPKLIKEKKYSSWKELIWEEYKMGATIERLIPFITAQNIPFEYMRSFLWRELILKEYRKGRTIQELIPYLTTQNISLEYTRSYLWSFVIEAKCKRGTTFQELIPFITAQNIPVQYTRCILWKDLIEAEKKKRKTIQELIPFITAQNIPDERIRSKLEKLIRKERSRN